MSTALRSVGLLDVLSSTPAEPSGRAPCIHARLRRLATKPGEKSGLGRRELSMSHFSTASWNPESGRPEDLGAVRDRLHGRGGQGFES